MHILVGMRGTASIYTSSVRTLLIRKGQLKLTLRIRVQSSPISSRSQGDDLHELGLVDSDTAHGSIGEGILGASGHRGGAGINAADELLRRPEPVRGPHVVLLVEAVGPGAAGLREAGAVVVPVGLALCAGWHVEEAEAEGERDGGAAAGGDIGPVDGGAVVAAGALEGLHVDCGGSGEECGERGETSGEKHGWLSEE